MQTGSELTNDELRLNTEPDTKTVGDITFFEVCLAEIGDGCVWVSGFGIGQTITHARIVPIKERIHACA